MNIDPKDVQNTAHVFLPKGEGKNQKFPKDDSLKGIDLTESRHPQPFLSQATRLIGE